LISVPKKRFHHAVDRNRVKRQMREAYRKNKQILLERLPEDRQLALALVWISDQHADSAEIERRMVSLLQRIAEKTANAPAQPQTPTT
jgi:ribonuclease P protein component